MVPKNDLKNFTSFAKVLNASPIDWCYDCADQLCKTSKQKMFAWIIINILKSWDAGDCFFDGYYEVDDEGEILGAVPFIFSLNLKFLEENKALKKELRKKKNWYFLKELIYHHFVMNVDSDILTKRFLIRLNNPEVYILNDDVVFEYDFDMRC